MPAPWPSCSAPSCCPRPGSLPRPSATSGPCCVTGPRWSGWPPPSSAGCTPSWPTGASGSRSRCGARPVGSCWLSFPTAGAAGRRDRLPGPDRCHQSAGRRLERDLVARARPDPRVQALQALPGIGPITAMTLVAEIGDIARFPTARKLCAWAGLTPVVRNSDRKVRHGHITKMGSPWSASCSRKPPSEPRPARRLLPSTPRPPPAVASTSPPWRRPKAPCSQLPCAHRTPSHSRRRSTPGCARPITCA